MRTDWLITHSGRKVHVRDPEPDDIVLGDIAHALAHLCRFGGHVRHFYSVAQHSVRVSHLVDKREARAGLLHDAAEAYIGDVIRPLKRELADYKAIESAFEECIAVRFGVLLDTPGVKLADMRALYTERCVLQPEATARALSGELSWPEDERGVEPDPEPLNPLQPVAARALFLMRAKALGLS